MSGLDTLRALNNRFADSGDHVALNSDMRTLIDAIRIGAELLYAPNIEWVSATQIRVKANSDSPARVLMNGFPNILNPGHFILAGLTDGYYRENTSDLTLDISSGTYRWGNEKVSQWYAVFLTAAGADTTFSGKLMPLMRVKSQTTQTISLGTNNNPNTGIGYGFTTDELVNYKIYMLSGNSRGLLRTVSANNNDNGTGGTITYSGSALTISQGDYFIVLPTTNFRWIGCIINNASSNIVQFYKRGRRVYIFENVNCPVSSGCFDSTVVSFQEFGTTITGWTLFYDYCSGYGLG